MSKYKKLPNSDIMCDSMDIVATFVSELGINLHNKYKGKNILKEVCYIRELRKR